MELYERWLQNAADVGLYVMENIPFESQSKGFLCDNYIALNKNIETSTEKACILAEEIGHYHTAAGNILNQGERGDIANRKQEYKGRLWAYDNQIGLMGIISACKAHKQTLYEMADYLNVTELFLKEALERYREKYGVCTTVDNYIVYFIPYLAVMEMYPTRNLP
ncbi:MAG: ImmA/IrrE family metallo-endopeptidase [Lachnospiraceae bacterium]|nr:ImmA/IrrE family metallo-endopeptidase [Lachnospiraceae bacterium]